MQIIRKLVLACLSLVVIFSITFKSSSSMTSGFDAQKFNKMLANQSYEELMSSLYQYLDKGDLYFEALKWVIDTGYAKNSVHLLYLYNRFRNKVLEKKIFLSKDAYRGALKAMLYSLVLIKLDIACCESVDSNKYCATANKVYEDFKSKYWHMWGSAIESGHSNKFYNIGYHEVLNLVENIFKRKNFELFPSPAWIMSCSYKWLGWNPWGWGMYYGSVSEDLKLSFNLDFSDVRREAYQETMQEFDEFDNWFDFFGVKKSI